MKIDVTRLGDGQSLVLAETWEAKEFDLETQDRRYLEKLVVEAKVARDNAIVNVKVLLRSNLELRCSRCCKEFVKPLSLEFDFIYPVNLSDRFIILDDDIREELILNYPQRNLCKEDCKGLCSHCGADLNEEKCKLNRD